MGGSILAQVHGSSSATRCPTSTIRSDLEALLRPRSTRCATTARCSPTTTAATAACGRRRARWPSPATSASALNVDLLVTEGDGIADSRADYGDAKNWAQQVSARREELTLRALFNEELGAVVQVRDGAPRRGDADRCATHGLRRAQPRHRQDRTTRGGRSRSGATRRRSSARRCATCTRPGTRSSWRICAPARQPGLRRRRARRRRRRRRSRAARPCSTFDPASRTSRRRSCDRRQRAQGRDPARAGRQLARRDGLRDAPRRASTPYDVHMTDLQSGRATLADFQGFVACGGFSYGDTLGAGEGWAAHRSASTPQLADQFAAFFAPRRHLRAGRLQRLPDDGRAAPTSSPAPQAWPRFTRNQQRAVRGAPRRWSRCCESPSIFFAGMAGSRAADRGRARRGLSPTSRSAATPAKVHRGDALRRQPRPADRGVSVQPERQRRRADRGDHRRTAASRR